MNEKTQPKVLLATTCRWLTAARIGIALKEVGCELQAVCPPNHPLLKTRVFTAIHRFRWLDPGRSFSEAIEFARPDLVVPCDELAALQLRRQHHSMLITGSAPVGVPELLVKSLGAPEHFSEVESRQAFLQLAKEEGIAVPATAVIGSRDELDQWLSNHDLPAVLKADGTSGGEGVQIVSTPGEAVRAFRRLQSPTPLSVVLKRSLVDRDHNSVRPWLAREPRNVSIQPFIRGREANIAFFAWKGEICASVSAEVLSVTGEKGPAAVIKVSSNPTILHVTQRLASRLGLSGFGGFDFIFEEGTGTPYLIELNARLTQTCHLALNAQQDLPGAAYLALTGERPRRLPAAITEDTIALFPAAWRLGAESEMFRAAYKDVPSQEPALITEGLRPASPINRENLAALKARLRQPWRTQKYEA